RKPGGVVLRAINEDGKKFLKKYDLHIAGKRYVDPDTGAEQKRPMSNWLRKKFNDATAYMPFIETLEKKARELEKQGYAVSIERDMSMPESVFDVAHLASSVDALLGQSLSDSKRKGQGANEQAAMEINKILTANVADLFKTRGYLSSRKKRVEDYWTGFEEDMLLAGTQYARGLAGGFAKRNAARKMVLAITGRDIPWSRWKEDNDGTWEDYQEFVYNRRLDPAKQPQLHAEAMNFMRDNLRNEEQIDRIMNTVKGLAVLKFLGFRVSSAAVNATNMLQAVPPTIASKSGGSITGALNEIKSAAALYGKYRSGKGRMTDEDRAIFQEIIDRGWAEAQFNHENAAVLQSKVGRRWGKFVAGSMYMFCAVEKANRATTIFAAYRQLRKNTSMDHAEAMKQAKHISDRAHGVYGKGTLPGWARGAANPLRLSYTFIKFSHNYVLNMVEMGYKGDIKEAAYMLIAPGILAGAGASLATPLLSAMASAFGIGGDDPEEEFYAWAENTFGSDAFARHGVAGLAGVNLKGSLQLNNPMPTNMSELFGAPQAIFMDTKKGVEHIGKGEVYKGIEALLPTAFGNISRAAREHREGITTGSYSPVFYGNEPLKADEVDFATRLLSFNPSRLSAIREKQWSEKKVAARLMTDLSPAAVIKV
ncbi:MAG: PLxRFG domain-containing protein, partial [Desulfobulbaceae bacterium]|nr:PLxRFG domain-containing protein [Desulfobulbaceae bacterium]